MRERDIEKIEMPEVVARIPWYDFWSTPIGIVEELRYWWIWRKEVIKDANEKVFMAHDPQVRIDWLGRLYTVVNLPEELYPEENAAMRRPFVLDYLSHLDHLLMKMRLNDLVYPEIREIPNRFSYLIILSPFKGEFLNFGRIVMWLIKAAAFVAIWSLADRMFIRFSGFGIVDSIKSLFA
jgi:hypothetical protein